MLAVLASIVMQENTLSEVEREGLRVLCNHVGNKELWTCQDCNRPPGWDRMSPKDRRRIVSGLKRQRGCKGKAPNPMFLKSDGSTYFWCPRLYEQMGLWRYIQSYLWFEDTGVMPIKGGLNDQPHKWIEAVEVIRNEFRMIQKYETDRQMAKARSKAKGG